MTTTDDSRVAIVTAAGKGMGEAIARRLQTDGYRLGLMSNSGGAEHLGEELGSVALTGASIVNISTFAAFESDPAFSMSASLRAELGSFTKLYSDRYAADGIRMKNVLSGFIDQQRRKGVDRCPDTARSRRPCF